MCFYSALFRKWIAPSEKNFAFKTVDNLPIIGKNRLAEKTIDVFLKIVGIDQSSSAAMEKKSLARYSIVPAALMGTIVFSTSLPIIVSASICLLGYAAPTALNCAYDYFSCRNDFKAFDKWLKDGKATGDKQKALKTVFKAFIHHEKTCDLHSLKLNVIPKELFNYLSHIESLYLSHNNLEEIPKEISTLKALKDLMLSYNQISAIPYEICEMSQLTNLLLSHNQIKEIPANTAKLINLAALNLSFNQIERLPDLFLELSNSSKINLESNPLIGIYQIFEENTSSDNWLLNPKATGNKKEALRRIIEASLSESSECDLKGLDLNSLPEKAFEYLPHLKTLDLSNNAIEDIPTTFKNLKGLEKLDLSSNLIKTVPDELLELSQLQELNLSSNRLQGIYNIYNEGIFKSWINNQEATGDKKEALKRMIKAYLSESHECDLKGLGLNLLPKEVFKYLSHLKYIDLSSNQIQELPHEFFELKNLEYLHLNNNHFNTIPENISKLENLNFLGLGSNQIEVVSDEVCSLKTLRQLYLQNNKISIVPENFSQLEQLEGLDLSGNQIETIDDVICNLKQLEQLSLSNNKIKEIPASIVKLTELKILNLSSNQIEKIPDSLLELSNIHTINLKSNRLIGIYQIFEELILGEWLHNPKATGNKKEALRRIIEASLSESSECDLKGLDLNSLPEKAFKYLPHLKTLDLSDNAIEDIPTTFKNLTSLEKLDLSSNLIKTVPNELLELSQLQELNLSSNLLEGIYNIYNEGIFKSWVNNQEATGDKKEALKRMIKACLSESHECNLKGLGLNLLPKEVFKYLSHLKSLVLSFNQIQELPHEFFELKNLEHLHLKNNHLNTIPETISKLENLKDLRLSDNQIETIPNGLCALKSLESLSIQSNKISIVPESISELTQLKMLYLGCNQIETIDGAICKLVELQKLSLEKNKIKEIPKEIAALKNLEVLMLLDNQIETVPDEILELPKLFRLKLAKNPLVGVYKIYTNIFKKLLGNGNKKEALRRLIKASIENEHSCDLKDLGINLLPTGVFEYLPNLEILYLDNNKFTAIPIGISKLKNLKELYLNNNQLSGIWGKHFELDNLKKLHADNNQIYVILEEIPESCKLEELSLSGNQIESIPHQIFDLKEVIHLNLSSNPIKTIPDEITKLKNLKELILADTQMTEIPEAISSLKNLIALNLSGNSIKKLPPLWGLKQLQDLNLGNNKLTDLELDPSLFYLTTINSLYLNNNSLEGIPTALGNLSNLKNLKIYNESIRLYPPSIERLKLLEGEEQGVYAL